MVNEINKPSTTTRENEVLRVRMENANRNVQSMQQEHNELLREMERLRQRASELSLRQSQDSCTNTNNEVQIATHQNNECESINSGGLDAELVTQLQVEDRTTTLAPSDNENNNGMEDRTTTLGPSDNENNNGTEDRTKTLAPSDNENNSGMEDRTTTLIPTDNENNNNPTSEMAETEDDPESAEYIRQKIEEIAALKAQFKRVQHMVNTSNLIEEHLSHGIPSQEEVMDHATTNSDAIASVEATTNSDPIANLEAATTENEFNITSLNYGHLPSTTVNDDNQDKEELLRAMLSMFNDFTTDLRDQATTLRAERDRLRALRDDILNRRRQQS